MSRNVTKCSYFSRHAGNLIRKMQTADSSHGSIKNKKNRGEGNNSFAVSAEKILYYPILISLFPLVHYKWISGIEYRHWPLWQVFESPLCQERGFNDFTWYHRQKNDFTKHLSQCPKFEPLIKKMSKARTLTIHSI